MRLVVQAVGRRIDTYFDRDWNAGEEQKSRLVVIGLHDMDEARSVLKSRRRFASPCTFSSPKKVRWRTAMRRSIWGRIQPI